MAYGDQGDSVRAMQNRLMELGFFAGDADGIYGDETQTAVKNFQTANGLANTGTADETTIARMRSEEAISKEAYLEALVAQAQAKGEPNGGAAGRRRGSGFAGAKPADRTGLRVGRGFGALWQRHGRKRERFPGLQWASGYRHGECGHL